MGKITKEVAAGILQSTERTVERMAGKGLLSVSYKSEPGRTRKVPLYDEDEVRRRANTETISPLVEPAASHVETIATNADTTGDNSDMAALVPRSFAPDALAGLVAMLEAARTQVPPVATVSDLSHKLTLSLVEASQLSGLSRGHLRAAIAERKLKAAIIGRGWRMKRGDLESYVRKM